MTNELKNGTDSLPVVYGIADSRIEELRQELSGLTAETKEGYEECRKGIGVCRELRVSIEARRVELKADALSWGRKVDSEAKRLTAMLLEIEEPLKIEKAKIDDEKDRIVREKKEAERAKVEAEIRAKRDAEEVAAKAIRDAEEIRLKAEREKLAAERAEMEAQQAKVRAEQKAERDRLDAIRRNAEEQQRIEREKIAAEQRAIEAERQRLEREEFTRQAKAKAEEEARQRAERERIEANWRKEQEDKRKADVERAATEERKRIESLRPDVEKLKSFAAQIRSLQSPDVDSGDAKKFALAILTDLASAAVRCETWTGT